MDLLIDHKRLPRCALYSIRSGVAVYDAEHVTHTFFDLLFH